MFDFQKLIVYQKAKAFHQTCCQIPEDHPNIHRSKKDQLSRASLSIALNIAEGTSRFTNASKRNYFVIARGSVFECVAVLDMLKDQGVLEEKTFLEEYEKADELSRMLFKMIRNLE